MRAQCAILLVVLLDAVDGAPSNVHASPEPARCCMAPAYTAVLTDLSTINSRKAVIFIRDTFDFNQQKEGSVLSVFNPRTSRTTVLSRHVFDFAQGVQYEMPEGSDNCSRTSFIWPMPLRCVPADAQYLYSSYHGHFGAPLTYDTWRFLFGPNWSQATLTMSFSNNGCVPITQGIEGPIDSKYIYSSYTTNFDKQAFDLRPSCYK